MYIWNEYLFSLLMLNKIRVKFSEVKCRFKYYNIIFFQLFSFFSVEWRRVQHKKWPALKTPESQVKWIASTNRMESPTFLIKHIEKSMTMSMCVCVCASVHMYECFFSLLNAKVEHFIDNAQCTKSLATNQK